MVPSARSAVQLHHDPACRTALTGPGKLPSKLWDPLVGLARQLPNGPWVKQDWLCLREKQTDIAFHCTTSCIQPATYAVLAECQGVCYQSVHLLQAES